MQLVNYIKKFQNAYPGRVQGNELAKQKFDQKCVKPFPNFSKKILVMSSNKKVVPLQTSKVKLYHAVRS